jgi:hypothetical protein
MIVSLSLRVANAPGQPGRFPLSRVRVEFCRRKVRGIHPEKNAEDIDAAILVTHEYPINRGPVKRSTNQRPWLPLTHSGD